MIKHIEESGLELSSNDEAVEQCRADFIERYSPEKLAALSDEEVLQYIFYSSGDNSDALCYWIERNTQCREFFGSIAGGSAYKFGLFYHKKNQSWTCGSPLKPIHLTEDEAIQKAEEMRNDLVEGAEIISSFGPLDSEKDYEQLYKQLEHLSLIHISEPTRPY